MSEWVNDFPLFITDFLCPFIVFLWHIQQPTANRNCRIIPPTEGDFDFYLQIQDSRLISSILRLFRSRDPRHLPLLRLTQFYTQILKHITYMYVKWYLIFIQVFVCHVRPFVLRLFVRIVRCRCFNWPFDRAEKSVQSESEL